MTVVSITISNIFGIESLRFQPGQVTVITGGNSSGKSSLLHGIASVFQGGVSPERLRIGAEKGSVLLKLDDGSEIEFRAWIKKKKDGTTEHAQAAEYRSPAAIPLPGAATHIKELGDALAVDPARLLAYDVTTAAGRKGLQQAILDVMPFQVTAADLDSVIRNVNDSDQPQPNELEARAIAASLLTGPVDLGGLRKAKEALTEKRRQIGIEARQADSTVQTLRKSVASEETPGDTEQQLAQAEADLAGLKKAIIEEQAGGAAEAAQERIKAEQEYQRKLRAIDKAERDFLETVEQEHAPRERELTERITVLRQQVAAVQQAEGARAKLGELEAIGKQKNHEYDLFSRAIGMLDEIKDLKLRDSPIPALAVEGDEITVDGVPWQAVNTARRVQIVVQLCAMRAGKLPFMLIDDAEHLEESTWAELKRALVEAGFQVVAAFVRSGEPLTVTTEDAVAA